MQWEKRPILDRLPYEGYRNNEVAAWLSQPWDDFANGLKASVDDLERQVDPARCDESWLDFLGALCGFTGEYWSKSWSSNIKRKLISASMSFLWRRRGTRDVLEWVLELFLGRGKFDIWTEGEFRAGVSILDVASLGEPEFKYFIRLPISNIRSGERFRIAAKLNRLYGVAFCDSDVVYDGFYCDFSEPGDPVFDEDDEIYAYL